MIDDSSSAPNVPWQMIMALLAGLGGVLYYYHGLESQRPAVVETHPGEAVGYEDVQSRIWQDPFKAAWDYEAELSAQGNNHPNATVNSAGIANFNIVSSYETNDDQDAAHSLSVLQHEIKSAQSSTLILPVMVPSGPYAELAENRLRTRAALLEALLFAGYRQAQEDHIGYVKLPWPERLSAGPDSPPNALLLDVLLQTKLPRKLAADYPDMQVHQLTVPYEWLAASKAPIHSHLCPAHFENILVLWLDEDAIGDFPLSRLAALVEAVTPPPTTCLWKIIGPRTSTTLRNLVANSCGLECHEKQILDAVSFYCATATEEDALLLRDLPLHTDNSENIGEYLKKHAGITLLRLGKTDRNLCECLATELRGRCMIGSPAGTDQEDSAIAVISEADTRYGRALPLTFASAASGKSVDCLIGAPSSMPCWLYTFTYLRGLDGRTGEKTSDETEQLGEDPNAKGQPASKLAEPGESPQGQNQADYLRRLADQLAQLDDSLQQKGRRLQAIGLLGTDVYDKLLILQAIRDRLPKVLFFTTELDAVYTLPSEWNATHNLLIASSYGFRLHEYYQNGIPPFRDSSQTAIFTAALNATGATKLPKTDASGNMAEQPRLFQISRFGAFDITSGDPKLLEPDGESSEVAIPKAPPTIHPPRYDLVQPLESRIGSIICLMVCMACLLAVPIVFGVRPVRFRWEMLAENTIAFLLCALGAAILVWEFWPRTAAGEPFTLISGNSIWPTEMLRVFAGLLSVHLIGRSIVMRHENDKEVQKIFGLQRLRKTAQKMRLDRNAGGNAVISMATDSGAPTLDLLNWKVIGNADGVLRQKPARPRPTDCVYAQNLWWEYQRRGGWTVRLARTIPMVILTFGVFACLREILGLPYIPARTSAGETADKIILIASVFLFYVLTYWVLDVAYTNRLFIKYLTGAGTKYSRPRIPKLPPGIELDDVVDYLDIRLIAKRSKVVGEAVYYPFFVLALMIIARSSIFADWDWSPFILSVFAVNILLAILGAALLRSTAETARKQALQKIGVIRLRYVLAGESNKVKFMAQLQKRVQDEREGAFSILSQYPILGALLLPSGSVGLWAIVQYLPQLLR